MLVSTDDARQAALRALHGVIAVSLRGADAPQPAAGVAEGVASALSRALLPPLGAAAKGDVDDSGGNGLEAGFFWLSSSLCSAAEVAQVGRSTGAPTPRPLTVLLAVPRSATFLRSSKQIYRA